MVSILGSFHNYTYVYLKLIKLKLVSKAKLLAITEAYAYLGQRYSSRPLSGGLTSGPITGIYGTRRAIRLHKPKTVSMEHKETSLFKRWSLALLPKSKSYNQYPNKREQKSLLIRGW